MPSMRSVVVMLCIGFLMSSCAPASTTPTEVFTRVSDATLKTGDPIPVPTGETVLTVTGKIGAVNMEDGTIQMDIKAIESLKQVEYKVNDPFENVEVTYQGPLLSDLMALWKVDASATEIEMIALNDYVVTIPVSDPNTWPVVFAVKRDGEYMPVATRGPAMLVYPYEHFDFDRELFDDRWIWQIKSVNVK